MKQEFPRKTALRTPAKKAAPSSCESKTAPVPPAQQPGGVSVQLHVPGADNPVACIELTAAEESYIRAAWLKKSTPIEPRLGDWVKSALLRQANRDMVSKFPLIDLEDAVMKAIGLLSMMMDSNAKLQMALADDSVTDWENRGPRGIELLANSVSIELLETFNDSFDYATGRKAVAA